ncbi:MAG TPA: alpha/beta hydrolase domain-containing protein [Bacteroidales bacterium]|nr:alpha/beta hydrolase domain-containing protein [Bacteroidales bacterium]
MNRRLFLGFLFIGLIASGLSAKVVKVEIEKREIVLNGYQFGNYGKYEYIKGKVWIGIDPANHFNSRITDIHYAVKNENGMIEALANFEVLQPADRSLSRGIALVEVSNRGGKFSLSYFNRARGGSNIDIENPIAFGDGLLMRQGLTIIWIGWQFDVPDNGTSLRLDVASAIDYDGSAIRGLVRSDWTVDQTVNTLSLGHRQQVGYPVSDPDDPRNILTVRSGREAPRDIVPKSEWKFGRLEVGKYYEDPSYICSEKGFREGMIYEIVYVAENPVITGLGLATIRDVISYAKYDPECEFPVKMGIAAGVSQTGRFLRHYLYQGFNTDEEGRMSYDGLMIITAGAGRGSFNHRFAQPSRDAHRYSAFFYPTDIFPFTSRVVQDPEQWRSDGLLAHMWNEDHIPKIFYCNTGYEYWGRAASLIHTDPGGANDIEPYPQERIYMIASGQHFVGPQPSERNRIDDTNLFRGNPLDFSVNYRSLLVRLVDWVDSGKEPPVSAYPGIGAGTLTSPENLIYPLIGGLKLPTTIHVAYLADYGARWSEGIIDNQPPLLTKPFPSMVSAVDSIGNEIAGIRNIEIAVPLGTYLPWNLRTGFKGGSNELTDFTGTFIPLRFSGDQNIFPDSRPAIDELYPDFADYENRVKHELNLLKDQGYILEEDMNYLLGRSKERYNNIRSLLKVNQGF